MIPKENKQNELKTPTVKKKKKTTVEGLITHLRGNKIDFSSLNVSCKILSAPTQILVTGCHELKSFPCTRTGICAGPSLALTNTSSLLLSLCYLQREENETWATMPWLFTPSSPYVALTVLPISNLCPTQQHLEASARALCMLTSDVLHSQSLSTQKASLSSTGHPDTNHKGKSGKGERDHATKKTQNLLSSHSDCPVSCLHEARE